MEIVLYPDPVLRRRAEPVVEIDDEVRAKVEEMFELMHRLKGVGLAAPQGGWSKRVLVYHYPEEGVENQVLINPTISNLQGHTSGEEGCLSFPGIYAQIERAEQLDLEAIDLQGNPIRFTAKGFPAIILQHEHDHLEGVLFHTRMSTADRLRHKKKLAKLEQEYRRKVHA